MNSKRAPNPELDDLQEIAYVILIEVKGGDSPRYRLEFHPRLTIVSGLDRVQRKELASAIKAAFTGNFRRMEMTVDIGGQPQHLSYDTVLELGMEGMELDNIVSPSDAPGAVVTRAVAAEVTLDPDAALAEANAKLAEAQARVAAIEARLAQLGTPPEPVDEAEFALAVGLHERAQERVAELRAKVEAKSGRAEIPLPDQLARVEEVQGAVEERIKQLHAALVEPPKTAEAVATALKQASGASQQVLHERTARTAQLAQAAGDWNRLLSDIARLENQPRPPDWLVLQTKDALDEATAHVKALTYQAQQEIEVEAPLARARQQLSDAQAAWAEIEHGVEGQLAALQTRQDVLYSHVVQFLGRDVDRANVVDELAREHHATQSAPHPNQPLVDALRASGVESTVDDAAGKATAWLDHLRQSEIARPENQRALAAAMLDLRDLNQQAEELRYRIENPEHEGTDVDPDESALAEASVLEHQTAERVAALTSARELAGGHNPDEAPALHKALADARGAVEAAKRRAEYFAKQAATTTLRPPDSSASHEVSDADESDEAESKPWWAGGMATRYSPEDAVNAGAGIDVYLLSRAARLRMLVHGESIPLIIDSVFENSDGNTTVRTLESLAKVSAIVQVIYLAGNDVAEKWAKKQDLGKVAVVHLERA